MRSRKILSIFCIVVLITGMVGFAIFAQDEVTLTFRQNDPPEDAKGLKEAVEEFDKQHPNINVKYQQVPWSDALNQFIRESRVGSGPDVVHIAFVWTKDLAEAGALLKLNPLMKEDPLPRSIDDFKAVELGKYKGGIYGIPWTTDTFAMPYRKDIFEEAGVSSFPSESWAEFKRVAKKLSNPSEGRYGFGFPAGPASDSGVWFLVNYYLWSNGHTFVEQKNGEWQLGVKSETIAETMEYFKSFFEEDISPESLLSINQWGNPELTNGVASGDFAIGFMPPASFRAVMSANPDETFRTGQVPAGEVTRKTHLGGRTLAINKNTEHPEAAWKLLKWMISEEVFSNYYRQQFSAQKTIIEKIDYGPEYKGYQKLIPQAQTFINYIDSPVRVQTMWAATNREFNAVFAGNKSVDQASESLVKTVRQALEESQS